MSNLTFLSRGLSVANDAKLFTSISHGFILSSKKMSKPRTSKHIEFSMSSGCRDLNEWHSYGYAEIRVFTAISSIYAHNFAAVNPDYFSLSSIYLKIDDTLRLWPVSSSAESSFASKFSDYLLIA